MKTILILSLTLFSLNVFAVDTSNFSCYGTEPFWGLEISGLDLTFKSPASDNPQNYKIISTTHADGYTHGVAFVIKTETTNLTLVNGACNDGMSEETFTHHAVFEINNRVLYGCCNIE